MNSLSRCLLAACATVVFSASTLCAFDDESAHQDQAASLIDRSAAAIYKLAWPTATYKSWNLDSFTNVPGGYDLVIKFSGLSAFDDSDLWLKLGFALRSDGIKNIWIVANNAILAQPFETTRAWGRAIQQAIEDSAQSRSVAPGRAGATCLSNSSDIPINFRYHWGNGAWQKSTVEPHRSMLMWWTYDSPSQDWSPQLQVEYDDNLADGYTPQLYNLERSQSSLPATCEVATGYQFTLDGNSILLHATR